jgi:phosphatidylserine/phosphatidylglycerophosphate/cardiolipin synthase-like enzyme
MMKLLLIFSILPYAFGQSVFIPENGKYVHSYADVTSKLQDLSAGYLVLKEDYRSKDLIYKLDPKRNEFVMKGWFQKDWYELQKIFSFSPQAYIKRHGGLTFNEAKRREYAQYAFSRSKFFHYKTMPSLKEWGGLTHPPFQSFDFPLELFDSKYAPLDYRVMSSPYFSTNFQKQVDQASRSELTFGNEVYPLMDKDAFEMKLSLVNSATKSILISSLVIVCDISTKKLVDALIAKHRRGVEVKILVDGFISKALGHTACLKAMSQEGIEVIRTKDFYKHESKAIYHTKTLIVDSEVAIAGGHNLLDPDNTSRGTDFKNRDLDLLIKGPMVTDIIQQFAQNWEYQRTLKSGFSSLAPYLEHTKNQKDLERNDGLRGQGSYERILRDKDLRMKGVCRFIKQAPYEDRHSIGKAYLLHLNEVKKHLVIEDPIKSDTYVKNFFTPPVIEKFDRFEMFNQLHAKVMNLAREGINIDYITTNINMAGNELVAMMNDKIREQLEGDKKMAANWSLTKIHLANSYFGKPHYENLIKDYYPFPNVHVWNHMSFMHSKVFYFDRVAASVGSYNFHHNATDHSYESTVICLDENLNRQLDRILVHDMANSIPLIFSRLR